VQKALVAIVGRPNVGKSTLFNRIVRGRRAIVDDRPGVTRDRIRDDAEWAGRPFTVMDTGGYVHRADSRMETLVRRQIEYAIEEADLLVLLTDVASGITDLDMDLARMIQRTQKPCLLAVNKVDSDDVLPEIYEFVRLGLGDPVPVSALTGRRSGDLLDEIVRKLPEDYEVEEEDGEEIKIAVLGRPNAGKSTLVNALVGREEVIVDERPGTTRDSVDTLLIREGRMYRLIDTAGLRRKGKIKDDIEFYSWVRAVRSLERCDVALMLLDAADGYASQDSRILARALETGKASVIAVNKWDAIEKDSGTAGRVIEEIRTRMPFASHLPVIFLSALRGQRIGRALKLAAEVYERSRRAVQTSHLNKLLQEIRRETPPLVHRGREVKLYYCTQSSIAPPSFLFFSNAPEEIPDHYRRFLERRLREAFGFEGVPIRIAMRRK